VEGLATGLTLGYQGARCFWSANPGATIPSRVVMNLIKREIKEIQLFFGAWWGLAGGRYLIGDPPSALAPGQTELSRFVDQSPGRNTMNPVPCLSASPSAPVWDRPEELQHIATAAQRGYLVSHANTRRRFDDNCSRSVLRSHAAGPRASRVNGSVGQRLRTALCNATFPHFDLDHTQPRCQQ
jgi:hypothetical protein